MLVVELSDVVRLVLPCDTEEEVGYHGEVVEKTILECQFFT